MKNPPTKRPPKKINNPLASEIGSNTDPRSYTETDSNAETGSNTDPRSNTERRPCLPYIIMLMYSLTRYIKFCALVVSIECRIIDVHSPDAFCAFPLEQERSRTAGSESVLSIAIWIDILCPGYLLSCLKTIHSVLALLVQSCPCEPVRVRYFFCDTKRSETAFTSPRNGQLRLLPIARSWRFWTVRKYRGGGSRAQPDTQLSTAFVLNFESFASTPETWVVNNRLCDVIQTSFLPETMCNGCWIFRFLWPTIKLDQPAARSAVGATVLQFDRILWSTFSLIRAPEPRAQLGGSKMNNLIQNKKQFKFSPPPSEIKECYVIFSNFRRLEKVLIPSPTPPNGVYVPSELNPCLYTA